MRAGLCHGSFMLDQELFRLGGRSITLLSLIVPVFIFTATLVLASAVARLFARFHKRAEPTNATLIYVSGQLLRYVILFGGLFATISAAGLNLSSLAFFAGALGVGIGLGLQDIVKNFTYGILLLLEQSVEVGDFIELEDGTAGQVVAIGARATTINTNDNVDILVPNAMMLSGALTNWTRNQGTRRIHVPFSVAYGSDKELVKRAALEAANAVPFTQDNGDTLHTQVWLTGFGDSALEFELVVWPTLQAVKRPGSMMAAYRWALDDALRKHGLEIPFPQQDIRIRSLFGREEEAALEAMHHHAPEIGDAGSKKSREPRASENDAAADVERPDPIEPRRRP